MDRRIKRTRTAVFNAALDLMLVKDAKKITVLELCKKADINKSTFYLHYQSIDDCLENVFGIIINGVVSLSKMIDYNLIKHNPEPIVDRILNEVEKNLDYLYRFKNSSISGASVKLLKENLVKSIAEHNSFTPENNYYEIINITFAVAGFVDVIIETLPNFNKALLSQTICKMIKSN